MSMTTRRSSTIRAVIDPQLQPLLDMINAAAQAAPGPASLQERRDGYLALSTLAGPGPELDHVEDRRVPGPAGDIPVRIYRNDGASGIFVYFHGGGFTIGDLNSHDEPCRQIAVQSGATVVSVDYRLAPESPFPAAVDDAWAALAWVDSNRSEIGGSDDAKIVVGGDSAGGNLAAVTALMARDAGVELAAQCLVYPGVRSDDDSPSMTENGVGYVLDAETMDWFMAQYAPDPSDWRASPIRAASHVGVAPALVITAQYDPLRDQGADYAEVLTAAGVPVTYTNYDGMVHVFFQLGPMLEAGARAVSQVAEFARNALA
jgi:acetyl esterase/lipase